MAKALRVLYVLSGIVFLSLGAVYGQGTIQFPDRNVKGQVGFINNITLPIPTIAVPGTIYATSLGGTQTFNNTGGIYLGTPTMRDHDVWVAAFGGDYWFSAVVDLGPQRYHFGYAATPSAATGVYDPVKRTVPQSPTTPIIGVDLKECAGRVRVRVIEPAGANYVLPTGAFQVNQIWANPRSDPGQGSPTFSYRPTGTPGDARNAYSQAYRNANTSAQPVDLFVRESNQATGGPAIRYQIRVEWRMTCTLDNPACTGEPATSQKVETSYFEGATAPFGSFGTGGAASVTPGANQGINIVCDGSGDLFVVKPVDCMRACPPPPPPQPQTGELTGCVNMIGEAEVLSGARTQVFASPQGAHNNVSNTGGTPLGSLLFNVFNPAEQEGNYRLANANAQQTNFLFSRFAFDPLAGTPQNIFDAPYATSSPPPPNGSAMGTNFCMVPGIFKGTVTLVDADISGNPTGALSSLDKPSSLVYASGPNSSSISGNAQRDYRSGSYVSATGVYTIPYENRFGNANNASGSWQQRTHFHEFYNNAVAPTLYKIGASRVLFFQPSGLVNWIPTNFVSPTYTGNLEPGTSIAERAARFVPVDYEMCYSRLTIQIDARTAPLFDPHITMYQGTFSDDNNTPTNPTDDIHLYDVDPQEVWLGTPRFIADAGTTAYVNLSLPQGRYTGIGGWVRTKLSGQGQGTSDIPRIDLNLGCGEACEATQNAILCLKPIPECNDPVILATGTKNILGTLNHTDPIVSGFYTINNSPQYPVNPAAVGVICNSFPCSDNFTIPVSNFVSCGNLIVVGFTDNQGRVITNFLNTRIDQVAPAMTCPGNLLVPEGPGPGGTVVNYTTPTATDACVPNPNVDCTPPSGSKFPVGSTVVTCRTNDGCNPTECNFTVTVGCGASDVRVLCDTEADGDGFYNVTFKVSNQSGVPAHYLLSTQLPAPYNIIHLVPPIPHGGSRDVTVNVHANPQTSNIFHFTLADQTVNECCSFDVRVDFPDCDCVQFPRKQVTCNASGSIDFGFDLTNLTVGPVEHLFLFPPLTGPNAGVTITPNYVHLGTLQSLSTVSVPPVTITGAVPGSQLCIRLSIHDHNLNECCAREVCFQVPTCGCDDGNVCTRDDRFMDGLCVSGPPVDCDDDNPCTDDTCAPGTGCVSSPATDGNFCDDGNTCTTDTCSQGACVGTSYCDDGDACTTESCDPLVGCVSTPLDCDDGNACTADLCNPAVGCENLAIFCDDGNTCTGDLCDATGGCVYTPINCDDGNVCTDDACSPVAGCVSTPNQDPCDDGDACTTNDVCSNGVCAGTPGPAPSETDGVLVAKSGTDTELMWTIAPGATSSDVIRGDLSALPVGPGGGDETCLGNTGATAMTDTYVPAANSGVWYLIRGVNACGARGTYGNQGVQGGPGPLRVSTSCP